MQTQTLPFQIGQHYIYDIWDANRSDDIKFIEEIMLEVVKTVNATLLHKYFFHFTENKGVSGVCVLAESHLSLHSWPEYKFIALDLFTCGEHTYPERALPIFKKAFQTDNVIMTAHERGRTQHDAFQRNF